jgi:hypothetical protein
MSNVISLAEKRETWRPTYEMGRLSFHLSNHGRFKVLVDNETVQVLSFFDSVSLLKDLSEDFEHTMNAMYKDVV